MSGVPALILALVVLGLTLATAVLRPARLPEAVVATGGALLLLAVGAISLTQARHALGALAPTVGFLAALLLIAEGCRRAGLFTALGDLIAARCAGRPRRLLALVFAVAAAVTIVLGLDATVVLLPPIVLVTARRLRTDVRAPLYACAHLANSASLLLPVSNLTNLLAFRASGLSFLRFAALMALSTALAVAVEWAAISRYFAVGREARATAGRADLGDAPANPPEVEPGPAPVLPRFPLAVLALTLVGFGLSSALSVDPVWVAVTGAAVLTAPALAAGTGALRRLLAAAEPGFLVFVLALGVIVATASRHGLASGIRDVLPAGGSLGDLLLIAAIAAVLANVVNNLPATLILLPVAAGLGTGPVLAMLVGVNVGPNLTPVGSLATLLWRRVLAGAGVSVAPREFFALGVLTVPAGIVLATLGIWVMLRLGV